MPRLMFLFNLVILAHYSIPMDKRAQIIYFVQNNIFFQAILVSAALIINIVPRFNNIAYASIKVFHVILIYLAMQWVQEIAILMKSEEIEHKIIKDHQSAQKALRKTWYIITIFAFQCGLLDLVYFGVVIIYHGCIVTQELTDKGIILLILVFLIHIGQLFVDTSLIINLFRSRTIIDSYVKDN